MPMESLLVLFPSGHYLCQHLVLPDIVRLQDLVMISATASLEKDVVLLGLISIIRSYNSLTSLGLVGIFFFPLPRRKGMVFFLW